MTVGRGGAGKGYNSSKSSGKGRARELVLRGRITIFLLRITS